MMIFVRHGVRGIEGSEVMYAVGENLSFYGQIYSYKLGKYIRKKYGVIDMIYPDNNTERTIATGIAIAKGNRINEIYLSEEKSDPFFSVKVDKDPNELRKRLEENKGKIEELGKEINLERKNRNIQELLKALSSLCNVPAFSKLSKMKCEISKSVENICLIKEKILYGDVFGNLGRDMMNNITYLLKRNKLSVLVGHDESNIGLLSLYFNKTFSVDGYCPGYIPPNSGFIFTLCENKVKIDILYLTTEGKFKVKSYKCIPNIFEEKEIGKLKKIDV